MKMVLCPRISLSPDFRILSPRIFPGFLLSGSRSTLRGGREAFEDNDLIQNWIVRHIQIIGEAAREEILEALGEGHCLLPTN
jgi:hypothetical protein